MKSTNIRKRRVKKVFEVFENVLCLSECILRLDIPTNGWNKGGFYMKITWGERVLREVWIHR
jgi:hypothetical protein